MIEVGSVVKSKYRMENHTARLGFVIKLAGKLAQIYWPHRQSAGWVKCEDMMVVA